MLKKPTQIRTVYLDHAAAAPLDPRVLEAMMPYLEAEFGNPSALYSLGARARRVVSASRNSIAEALHARSENIIFTSGGTEANNLALFGIAYAQSKEGKHIVSIGIEHQAIINPLAELARRGYEITFVQVDSMGRVDPDEVVRSLRPDTILVTTMYANNEIGTIEPIADIGRAILARRKALSTPLPYFHTDACQAAGYLDLDVEKLHVDLLTANGSKVYGPKGTGFLYVRSGVKITPLLFGGGQEYGLRSGTENVAGIIGLAEALKLAQAERESASTRERELSQLLWGKLNETVPNITLNGPPIGADRLPNNIHVSIANVESEALLLYLDEYGILCSAGSACSEGLHDTSHVLSSIGVSPKIARGSVRFSLGRGTVQEDIEYVIKHLPPLVEEVRRMMV